MAEPVKGKQRGLGSWNLIKGALLQSDIAGYAVSEILAEEKKPSGDKEVMKEWSSLRTVTDILFLRERSPFFFFKVDHQTFLFP